MVPQPRPAGQLLSAAGWLHAGDQMSLRVHEPEPGTVVAEVTGEIDLGTARRLDEVLQARVPGRLDELVIDLSGVTFFSVAGLNSLLRARLLADAAGAHLTVEAGRSRAVRRLFTLIPTDLDSAVNVRPVR
ncbi:STAS domain-containing protein [Amycolatopsis sp. CA-128772]|uniref:STAS domain-containing protein n=1 Tax=Amycolatopsis sp. CA-128772 TaxID=2073159 RepID=UPI000CD30924|nr:STAS domain-containing protein [Amycolatopsis sp. CA-128772]